ncbi:MAG TPA: GtrA family protein [Hyphomonadaceae bacterium]|nr:GtrA family protein [Hyphomonadaceae bacterium]
MRAFFHHAASNEFLRFLAAGAVGFAVDYGMLLVFTGLLHWPPLMARVGSVALAISSTWLINRMWTFRPAADEVRARGLGQELLGYGAVQLTGAAANFIIYGLAVALLGPKPLNLLVALMAGSCAALAINYFGARRFVFVRD